MTRLVVLALLAAGCSPQSWPDSVTVTTADPTLAALLAGADARWESAGVDSPRVVVAAEPGALPAAWLPDDASMRDVCSRNVEPADPGAKLGGCVEVDRDGLPVAVWVNRLCNPGELANVVAHEMGHLLGVMQHLPASAAPALMISDGGTTITDADLRTVCEAGPCVAFIPEAGAP